MNFDSGVRLLENATIKRFAARSSKNPDSQTVDLDRCHEDVATLMAPKVTQLWNVFNGERPSGLHGYMSQHELADAYVAGYLLPNVIRIGSLLRSSQSLRTLFTSAQDTSTGVPQRLVMVDYGAGPLTATLAAALVAAELGCGPQPAKQQRTQGTGEGSSPRVRLSLHALVVEPSDAAWTWGLALLDELRPSLASSGLEVTVRRLHPEKLRMQLARSAASPTAAAAARLDLIIAANVLNELASEDKRDLFRAITSSVKAGAKALVLEPGQDTHSRKLASFRDKALAEQPDLRVLEPCTHSRACPLGPDSGRADWCWFRLSLPFPKSRLVAALDRLTGLQHDALNYSYVVFGNRQTGAQPAPQAWGRIVSDPIPVLRDRDPAARSRQFRFLQMNALRPLGGHEWRLLSQGATTKSLICQRQGQLLGVLTTDEGKGLVRGQQLLVEPDHLPLVLERTGPRKGKVKGSSGGPAHSRGDKAPRSKRSKPQPARWKPGRSEAKGFPTGFRAP